MRYGVLGLGMKMLLFIQKVKKRLIQFFFCHHQISLSLLVIVYTADSPEINHTT